MSSSNDGCRVFPTVQYCLVVIVLLCFNYIYFYKTIHQVSFKSSKTYLPSPRKHSDSHVQPPPSQKSLERKAKSVDDQPNSKHSENIHSLLKDRKLGNISGTANDKRSNRNADQISASKVKPINRKLNIVLLDKPPDPEPQKSLDKPADAKLETLQGAPIGSKKDKPEASPSQASSSKIIVYNPGKPSKHPAPRSSNFVPILLWWTTVFSMKWAFRGNANPPNCKVKCKYTADKRLVENSHAVFFHGWHGDLNTAVKVIDGVNMYRPYQVPKTRHNSQYYIFMVSEAPSRNRVHLDAYRNFFNWTITYRTDADFPMPDGHFVKRSREISYNPANKLARRPELIAWMVSNCKNAPSNRSRLVENLRRYIPVNIYGKCGTRKCTGSRDDCYAQLAKTHKFYLSFENSYCKDYVTEKFFNAVNTGMVPIVYGNVNYKSRFPPGSFINVDTFATPKDLAKYLRYLDQNDEAYLKYFEWNKYYYVNAYRQYGDTFCKVCERVHEEYSLKSSKVDVYDWYFGPDYAHRICSAPKIKFD